jgi:hypothetical protein
MNYFITYFVKKHPPIDGASVDARSQPRNSACRRPRKSHTGARDRQSFGGTGEDALTNLHNACLICIHVYVDSIITIRRGKGGSGTMIHLKHIYNFLCYMLVFTPFAYCFVTLRSTFMHFLELNY